MLEKGQLLTDFLVQEHVHQLFCVIPDSVCCSIKLNLLVVTEIHYQDWNLTVHYETWVDSVTEVCFLKLEVILLLFIRFKKC